MGAFNEDSGSTGVNGDQGNSDAGASSDAAYVFDISEKIGASYCVGAPNSVSPIGARIVAFGDTSVVAEDLTLIGIDVPNSFGLFFYGPLQFMTPFGDGVRCLGGSTQRLQPPVPATDNFLVRAVDFSEPSAAGILTAGANNAALNFQLWYRDPMGPGGNGFNATDGREITFQP